ACGAGALEYDLLTADLDQPERGFERIDLAQRVAVGLDEHRGERFLQHHLKAIGRRLGTTGTTARVLEDQLIANALSDAAGNGRKAHARQSLLETYAGCGCAVERPEAFTAAARQGRASGQQQGKSSH